MDTHIYAIAVGVQPKRFKLETGARAGRRGDVIGVAPGRTQRGLDPLQRETGLVLDQRGIQPCGVLT